MANVLAVVALINKVQLVFIVLIIVNSVRMVPHVRNVLQQDTGY